MQLDVLTAHLALGKQVMVRFRAAPSSGVQAMSDSLGLGEGGRCQALDMLC